MPDLNNNNNKKVYKMSFIRKSIGLSS